MTQTLENTTAAAWPGIGIHRNIPMADYHRHPGISAHRLAMLARSPAHLRYSLDNPIEQTPAMALGEALHTAVLEVDRFDAEYAIAPKCDRRYKDGKAIWAEFQASNAGKTIIDGDDFETVMGMSRSIRAHPAASMLLNSRTDTELSAIWTDHATGETCKLRADAVLANDWSCIVDVKTTEDARPAAFEKSIFNYAYHRQAAHYLSGMAASGVPLESFILIAVEKSPPYATAVYRLMDDVLAMAADEVARLIRLYAECRKSGAWPAYSGAVQDVGVPRWAMRQMEEL